MEDGADIPAERHRKVDAKLDPSFPHVESTLPAKSVGDFAYTITHKDGKQLMKHTKYMGRAGYFSLAYEANNSPFNTLFVKSTGQPKIYEAHAEIGAPFAYKLDLAFFKGEIVGAATKEDQYLDAENSIKLNALGIRARLPLGGIYLPEIETAEGFENVDSLVKEGSLSESQRPYMSLWAMETPYRISDILGSFSLDEKEQRQFLIDAAKYAQNLRSGPMAGFYEEFQGLIKQNKSTEDLALAWSLRVMDCLYDTFTKLAKGNAVHTNLSAHNMSLHGELCDNSSVSFDQEDRASLFAAEDQLHDHLGQFTREWNYPGLGKSFSKESVQKINDKASADLRI